MDRPPYELLQAENARLQLSASQSLLDLSRLTGELTRLSAEKAAWLQEAEVLGRSLAEKHGDLTNQLTISSTLEANIRSLKKESANNQSVMEDRDRYVLSYSKLLAQYDQLKMVTMAVAALLCAALAYLLLS